jgi:D-arginine dehydrogenase
VVGFAPETPGLFWLAGQGGAGLQTAPAIAAAAASLIVGTAWPNVGVAADQLTPARFG